MESLARDGGAPKPPYRMPLPGLCARPERSVSAGVPLLAPIFADADWNPAASSARLPGEVLVLRGGVKLCAMPKTVAGVVPAGGAAAFLVRVGVALARLMARVTALTCFLPAL